MEEIAKGPISGLEGYSNLEKISYSSEDGINWKSAINDSITILIEYNGGVYSSGMQVTSVTKKAGESITLPTLTRNFSNFTGWSVSNNDYVKISQVNNEYILEVLNVADTLITVTVTANWDSCVAAGTMVTLADGSKKNVEDLQVNDMVLVFNHETGKFDISLVILNDHSELPWNEYKIINLEFSDGTVTRIINRHSLFDVTLNKYVVITEENANDYVGHTFFGIENINSTSLRQDKVLVKVYLTTEYTGIYGPVTYGHMNLITDDLLSLSLTEEQLMNIFEYDETGKYDDESMKYNIETYGLYTYDEVKEYFTEDVYNALSIKYYKIQVGKGLTTLDEMKKIADAALND